MLDRKTGIFQELPPLRYRVNRDGARESAPLLLLRFAVQRLWKSGDPAHTNRRGESWDKPESQLLCQKIPAVGHFVLQAGGEMVDIGRGDVESHAILEKWGAVTAYGIPA